MFQLNDVKWSINTLMSRLTKSFWLLKNFVKRENFVNRDHLEPTKVTSIICLLTIILWLTNNFVNFKTHLFACKYLCIPKYPHVYFTQLSAGKQISADASVAIKKNWKAPNWTLKSVRFWQKAIEGLISRLFLIKIMVKFIKIWLFSIFLDGNTGVSWYLFTSDQLGDVNMPGANSRAILRDATELWM